MLASVMFRLKRVLDDVEDQVLREILRVIGMDEASFAAERIAWDYELESNSFTLRRCPQDFAIDDRQTRAALWAMGFRECYLECSSGTKAYSADKDAQAISQDQASVPELARAAASCRT